MESLVQCLGHVCVKYVLCLGTQYTGYFIIFIIQINKLIIFTTAKISSLLFLNLIYLRDIAFCPCQSRSTKIWALFVINKFVVFARGGEFPMGSGGGAVKDTNTRMMMTMLLSMTTMKEGI